MSSGATGEQAYQEKGKRIELDGVIKELQTRLGKDWNRYHQSLSLFLIGKLSRNELIENITPILSKDLRKCHNKLLLLNLFNSFQDGPLDYQSEVASFWNKKSGRTKGVKSSQYEKFKQNIMALPVRERRRLKGITRESGKKGKINASITLTRHELLPKIPMIREPEKQNFQISQLVQWQQDVVNGINAPLATQSFELFDYDNVSRQILMTMREHGLTGGLDTQFLEVVVLGLEAHLKNILESAIDVVRYREHKYSSNDVFSSNLVENQGEDSDRSSSFSKNKKRKVILNINDLYDTFELFPHLIEYCGAKLRLSNVMLQNDDMIPNDKDYELPERPKDAAKFLAPNSSLAIPNGIVRDENKSAQQKEESGLNSSDKNATLSQQDYSKLNGGDLKDNSMQGISPAQKQQVSFMGSTDELKWVLHDLLSEL